MADVPQKEIPRLRYPEELSKESFERDFAAKSEPVTRIFFHFWVSFVLYTFFCLNGMHHHGGNFVSPFSTIKQANQSFHVIGEGVCLPIIRIPYF